MKVEVSKHFIKSVRALSAEMQISVAKLLQTLERTERIADLPNNKKLKGHKSLYRIRLADHRVVYALRTNESLLLLFIAPRSEVYSKKFQALLRGL